MMKKRSFLFRIVIWTASVLIIAVAAYFLIRSFARNPIAGTWEYQDDNITMTIQSDDKVKLQFDNLQDVPELAVTMDCQVDKTEKTLVIGGLQQSEFDRILEQYDGQLTQSALDTALSMFTTSFDYSMERQTLTLTDREYGEQMIFDKNRTFPLYRKTDMTCDLGRGDFIHVEEEEYAAHTDKSNSDRKCKDRRQLSGCHPVYDKHKNRRCRSNGKADPGS